MQAAEELVVSAADEAQQRRDVEIAIAAANDAVKRSQAKHLQSRQGLALWEDQWARATSAAALAADASPAVVRAQLELVEELRSDVDEILSLEQRIADMEQDSTDFASQVTALAQSCGLTTAGLNSADLLNALASASREAAALQTENDRLQQQLAGATRRFADAETSRVRAAARLQPLVDLAGTADAADLATAIGRAHRAQELRRERDQLVSDILKAGGGLELEALLAECETAEAPALTIRSAELQDELTTVSDDIARLAADRATAQAAFTQLDAGPDAAVAAADIEQARAEMAVQAEAYVRKRAEAGLLKWAIARYRAEKQTPLLKRASDLFSKLTLGRYTELLVDLDGDKARLAGVAHDKLVVPVEGMSEGTVDQLFLALRLAAIEDAVDGGSKLPFLADDLFINYDDERAEAGFEVLAELAQKTQVMFFRRGSRKNLRSIRIAVDDDGVNTH